MAVTSTRRAQDGPRPGARPPAPAAAALRPDRATTTWLREAYGDVYRLNVFGIKMYVTAGADMAEQVLVNRDRVFANGPAWSHFIGPFFHRGHHAARLRRAPAPPADPAARVHQRRAAQLPRSDGAAHPAQPRGVGDGGEPAAAPHVQGAHPRPRPGDLRRRRPRRREEQRAGQQGVHRRGAGRDLDHPQAGPGHRRGRRGCRPARSSRSSSARTCRPSVATAATTCSPSCAARRARTATSSATTTSSTT